ncbi:MAG TPA: V-type ATP synthase subunit A, partial [bacterium]|nr:V-type ATP synthase subunit A [bacterium]
MKEQHSGKVYKVNGPIIEAILFENLMMLEVVYIGSKKIIGEVIKLYSDKCIIQVYEDTTMLKPDEYVYRTNNLLNVVLGPGLLSSIFDGIQRPLSFLFNNSKQPFISAGEKLFPLNTEKLWHFKPIIKNNSIVKSGDIIGIIDETKNIQHKIMVPNFLEGEIINIKPEGNYKITDTIAQLKTKTKLIDLKLYQNWNVRTPRPYLKKDNEIEPLLTGQRVIDTLFPVKKGGAVMIPGGFGTGKTMTQQAIAKWCDADIIVYIGCGERGNEMADVLKEFEYLFDYKNNRPLIERTIIIANTSNMPVAARETSIYTGITIAEYYRDMGYDVALMADSTSRWAEALRELSARMEEIPAEESYPAYLASYLAKFYERAGKVINLNSTKGSITVIGAVSPQGGDFSEPVTQQTKRFTKVFWALDKQLANERHYPAINWINSYSEYADEIVNWYNK